MNDECCETNDEWMNEHFSFLFLWMNEWDEEWFEFPHSLSLEKFRVILVDFSDFSLERNEPKTNGRTHRQSLLCWRN